MRIAIFGGSFDPVHSEHVCVAEAAIRTLRLDRLFIMPAHTPPHKRGKVISSDEDRLAMCRLAFAGLERAEVCSYEIERGGTSFTYLTCRYFREKYPDAEIFWLVGTDMLRDFPTWREPQSILNDVTLAVCARAEKEGWAEQESNSFYEKFGRRFAIVGYNGADVSSTKIRVLAGAGMRLTPFVLENVEAYIRKKGLYEISGAAEALALEKDSRKEHSLRVAETAAARAGALGVSEREAIAAALFHDCAKNLQADSLLLKGFRQNEEWGKIPESVLHQFTGAFVAENVFGVKNERILDAIRYHTSGKPDMTALGKLIFLADMVEEGRCYDGVEILRALFWKKKPSLPPEKGLDECLTEALRQTVDFLRGKGAEIYPLTLEAYHFYKEEEKKGDFYGK